MKLSTQMLRSRARGPHHSVEFLDLSRCNIGTFDKLSSCLKLQDLNLSYNDIDYLSCLDACVQLWKIDLSNNKVSNLEGLSRFVALGTLILCNNDLSWTELSKIRHMHILNLSLHGNPQLEKDPYYRIHVIDCLPNVWMLDGRIITSAERLQVEHFFEEMALTDRPVRHKLSKDHFVPSFRKKLQVTGVFGHRTDHFMRKFPTSGSLNSETDCRRILYLAYNLQEDLLLESKYVYRNWDAVKKNSRFLEEILHIRQDDTVRCNMLLLLLVSSLEFAIPTHLMQEALRCTKLSVLGNVECMELFMLPKEVRCHIVSLLLSAVKVDKDSGEEGGLYDKLYLCLYHCVSELTRLSQGGTRTSNKHSFASERTSKCLIASEVVQLLCIVPVFFDYITKDSGVMNLLTMATSDIQFVDRIDKLMKKMEQNQWEVKRIYENVAEVTLRAIQENTASLVSRKPKKDGKERYVLNTKKAATKRPQSSPIFASHFHMTGRPSPDKKPVRIKSGKPYRGSYIPQAQLGEKVLLGPQNVARVISVPEPELVLVQMDIVPDETGAMISNRKVPDEHYKYLDMKDLYWDYMGGFWRPKGTIGDRITMQSRDDMEEELITQAQKLATKDSVTDVHKTTETPRSESLEEQPKRNKVEIPRAVSARYKESHQLKLELEESFGVPGRDDKLEENTTVPPPPSRAKSARPVSQASSIGGVFTYDQIQNAMDVIYSNIHHNVPLQATDHSTTKPTLSEPEDGEEDELLYARSMLSRESPRSSLESEDEAELKGFPDSRPSTRPGTGVRKTVPPPKALTTEQIRPKTPSTTNKVTSQSPRSDTQSPNTHSNPPRSLSQASKASNPVSKTSTEIQAMERTSTTSECPIEIPQVDTELLGTTARTPNEISMPMRYMNDDSSARHEVIHENTSLQGSGDSNEAHGKMEEEDSDKLELGSMEEMYCKSGGGAADDVHDNVTTYSKEVEVSEVGAVDGSLDNTRISTTRSVTPKNITPDMTQTKAHVSSRPECSYEQYARSKMTHNKKDSNGSNQRPESPPPQRPSSPYAQRGSKKNIIPVQHGSIWLGAGRDIHWETKLTRPKSGHIPGWKVGLPPRPKSAAASRALKRSKTPNIVTPSSMAFDDYYGRNMNKSTSDLTRFHAYFDNGSPSTSTGHQAQHNQHIYAAPRRYNSEDNQVNDQPCTGQETEIYELNGTPSSHEGMSLLASHSYPHNKAQWARMHGPIGDVHINGHRIIYKANILTQQQMEANYEMVKF